MSDNSITTPPESPLPEFTDPRTETRKDALAGAALLLLCACMLLGGWAVLMWVDR